MKKWYQSVTIWSIVLGSLAEVVLLATETLPVTPETMQWLIFANGVIGIVLRVITTKPVSL